MSRRKNLSQCSTIAGTQPLTKEEIKILKQNIDPSIMRISELELLKAKCTHREKNGKSTLICNADNSYTCKICHKTFRFQECDEDEIQSSVEKVIDILQTCKSIYLDIPEELITEYSKTIPYLENVPKLYTKALENFNALYENPINNVGSFAALQELMKPDIDAPYGYRFYGSPYDNTNPRPHYHQAFTLPLCPLANECEHLTSYINNKEKE